MNNEDALKCYERQCESGICTEADKVAIECIREAIEREKGCEYCNGTEASYQHTRNTKISINTFGKARTIITECNPCPPFADCCMKDNPARSAFIINCCPNCGRKL